MHNRFHNFLLGVSILPALLVMPAMAGDPNISTENPAWVFGDISIANTPVRYAAVGGRRMNVWDGVKYQNDFPNYKLVGQSLSATNSDVYVGPVTLTLRELNEDENFAYNYQWENDGNLENDNEDVNLAEWAGIGWNESQESVYSKLAAKINSDEPGAYDNAAATTGGVYLYSRKVGGNNGNMSFDNTTVMVDGATVNANSASITNGSVLTFVKQDSSKLTDFNGGVISSNGVTTLNLDDLNVDNSHFVIKRDEGASLNINATNATFANVNTGDAVLFVDRNGSITVNGDSLVFDNNKSISHGGAFYYKDIDSTKGDSAVFNSKNITFSNNEVLSSDTSGSGGAIFVAGGRVSILGETNTFENNQMNSTVTDSRKYKVGGGAIANQSYWNENNHSIPVDAVMVIGKNADSTDSINTFSGNTSVVNGGAIMNRAIETDGNASLTINGITTFANNSADINGGAIYNVARDGRTATFNLNNGETTFTENTALNGGAVYNEGIMNFADVVFGVADKGNTATNYGGAIYNTGDITFNGNAVFVDNTDSTGANDIYNLGNITFNGETVMNGGMSGNGSLAINNGGLLTLNNANVNQGSITNAGTINLNGAGISDITNSGIINLNNGTASTIANSGTIVIAGTTDSISSVIANAGNLGGLQIDSTFDINQGFDWEIASVANNGTLNLNSADISNSINSVSNAGTLNLYALKEGIALTNAGTLNTYGTIDTGSSILGGDVNVISGTLTSALNGRSLNIAENAAAVLADTTLTDGATNNGDITFNNTFTGSLVNNNNATFNGANNSSSANVTNIGTVTLNGANVHSIANSGTVVIAGTGTNQTNTSVVANGTMGNLQIDGTFNIDQGFGWEVTSIANNGTLNLNSADISNSIDSVSNAGTLNLHALKEGIALTNAGTLNTYGTIDTGNNILGGDVNVISGTLTALLNGRSLDVAEDAAAVLASATLTDGMTNNGTITANGTVSVAGTSTNNGNMIFNNTFAGNLLNNSNAIFNGENDSSSANITNTGTVTLNDANVHSIANSGTVVIAGTETTTEGTSVIANADNLGGLQIDSTFDIDQGFDWEVASIANNGTLNLNSANISGTVNSIANNDTGTLNVYAVKEGIALTNAGTLNAYTDINNGDNVLGGDVNVISGTLTSALNGRSLNVAEDTAAVLAGATLTNGMTNNGTITASGAVSVGSNSTNNGDITFDNTFAGTLINNSNVTFNGANNSSSANVKNTGTVTLNDANVKTIANSGTIIITGTGTNQANTSVTSNGGTKGDLKIAQGGVFNITQGFNSKWAIDSIENNGTLNVASTINNSVSLVNNENAILNLQGGINLGANRAIANSGIIQISGNGTTYKNTSVDTNNGKKGGLQIANNGRFSIGNDFNWLIDYIKVENGGELTLNSTNISQSILSSGTVVIAGSGTTYTNTSVGANNDVKGGLRIAENGTFTVDSGFAWAVDNINNQGELNISYLGEGIALANSGTLNVSGGDITLNSWYGGDVNVISGTLTSSDTNANGDDLNVYSGARAIIANATLTGNLVNNGTLTSSESVFVDGNIKNYGTMTVAGSLSGSLNNTGDATLGAFSGSLTNNGNIILNNGTSTFADGIAGSGNITIVDDAIVNIGGDFAGTLINNANLVFDGDTTITKNITGEGTLTVAENQILRIGTSSIEQDTIVLNGDMFATLRRGGTAQINAATSFEGDGTLNLTMLKPGKYRVFGTETFDNIAWSEDGISKTNPVYDLVWDNGYVTATQKSIEDIAEQNNLKSESAQLISGLMKSSSGRTNALMERIQEELSLNHSDAVEDAVKVIHPEQESVVQSISTSIHNTISSLTAGRMNMPAIGRSGGDLYPVSSGFWLQGVYNKAKSKDVFNGYTRGLAIGLDQTFKNVWMFGVGYSYTKTNMGAYDRGLNIDSSSVFVYGQYKKQDWFVNAMLNYTVSDYSEKGEALGIAVTSDYRVDSYAANIKTGYTTKSGFSPEVGLRYMHVSADDYWNSLGVKVSMQDSDYLTPTIGAKYAFAFAPDKKLVLRPELRALLKYDVISDNQRADIVIPGVNGYTLSGNRLSRFGGEVGIGIGTVYKGVDLSVNYDVEAREEYTSQTGRFNFRYNF